MRHVIDPAPASFLLIAALALVSCSAANPAAPADQASGAPVPHIVVLGDSLAVSPTVSENFPAFLQRRLDDAGHRWRVINAGVGSAVTADGVRRLDSALTAEARILVLALGANDGLRGLPVDGIEQNLATIIERAQARGVLVLLCGMLVPPIHGWDYTVEFQRVFPRVAGKYGVPLVPFLLAKVALNASLNGPDGIHPNAAGAQQIADTVWPYIEELIEARPTVTR
jgi:acyl-CoA thioesterase I